jgi:hypothetical protein
MAQTGQISQRSVGTKNAVSNEGGGGVVVRTPSANSAAYNPGGTGGATVRKSPMAVPTPGGRNVASVRGRTVAGSGKTIGSGQ